MNTTNTDPSATQLRNMLDSYKEATKVVDEQYSEIVNSLGEYSVRQFVNGIAATLSHQLASALMYYYSPTNRTPLDDWLNRAGTQIVIPDAIINAKLDYTGFDTRMKNAVAKKLQRDPYFRQHNVSSSWECSNDTHGQLNSFVIRLVITNPTENTASL